MVSTYSDYSKKTSSEKITLCWVHAKERLPLWTLDSGAVYKRSVNYFIVDVLEGSTSLTKHTSTSLSAGQWYFNSSTKMLYIRTSDSSDPKTKNVVVKYRFFFSSAPLNLPWDLDSGEDVEYEGRLEAASPISKELDEEQIGIALESDSTINLENLDGFFDDIYDTLFFEFKETVVYSWSIDIPLSEKKLLFSGIKEDKSFSPSKVTFKAKDFVYKLKNPVQLENYTLSDGDVSDSFLYTPKRRLYGQFQNLQCVPIDNILDGFTLTGTISGALGSSTIYGVGTDFLDELSPGDKIIIELANEEIDFSIEEVVSDTEIVISEEIETSFASMTAKCEPDIPYRRKNRNWHIAGHKLREPVTTITAIDQANRITVADATDILPGDLIDVDGEDVFVKRVRGNDLVLRSNLQGSPTVSDSVSKNPVSKAYIGENEIFINRDWTVSNTSTDSILVLDDLAEFNITKPRSIIGSFTFTNSSRTVTATGVNLLDFLETRDWIRSDDITHTTWYEILSVSETQIVLRTAYAGGTTTTNAQRKNVEYVDDDTLITVNCIGLERGGAWIKNASLAVQDMLENDSGITNINQDSFDYAALEAPYILSLSIPEKIGSDAPIVRDVVSKINQSVFGSLVNNIEWEVVYNILSQDKPSSLEVIRDDDIIGAPRISSKNKIVRKINLSYRPFVDRFKEEDTFSLYEYTNSFVDDYIGAKEEMNVTAYLFNESDAQMIAERYALFNSLSQSVVSIKTKLNLSLKNLNDKLWISFDRIYKRFGNRDRQKIGIINRISKNGEGVDVEFNDLANTFNRVMSIAPNDANDFTSASDDEKIFNCYICDNDLEVPNVSSEKELGTQIIG